MQENTVIELHGVVRYSLNCYFDAPKDHVIEDTHRSDTN